MNSSEPIYGMFIWKGFSELGGEATVVLYSTASESFQNLNKILALISNQQVFSNAGSLFRYEFSWEINLNQEYRDFYKGRCVSKVFLHLYQCYTVV